MATNMANEAVAQVAMSQNFRISLFVLFEFFFMDGESIVSTSPNPLTYTQAILFVHEAIRKSIMSNMNYVSFEFSCISGDEC